MSKKSKGWFNEIVIRPVVNVDGYESYEKMCGIVAEFYYSSEEQKLLRQLRTNPKDSRYITLYTLFKVGQAKCPAYWVNNDLLSALMQSNLDIEVENLQWAMKTGFFMLPKGVILSPEKRSIDTIFWHCDTSDDLLYWAAIDRDSVFCRRFKISDNLKKFTYTDTQDFNPQVVTDFNQYLQSIFLRLILIMECRPELVDKESELVRVNKGFGKAQAQDFYQPLWLGLGYRLKREGTQGSEDSSGIHGTKSVHWRRGFLRNQPYGEGRQQRKLVWIEPVIDNESQSVGNWNDVKKSKLIESFIINFPIMPIVMYEKSYHTYKVIDGKQRLKAIVDFYSNQLVLSGLEVKTELNGCTYATLPYHAKTVLNRHSLSLISIIPSEDASPEEIAKIIEIIAERLN